MGVVVVFYFLIGLGIVGYLWMILNPTVTNFLANANVTLTNPKIKALWDQSYPYVNSAWPLSLLAGLLGLSTFVYYNSQRRDQ